MAIIAFHNVSKSFSLQRDRPRSFQELVVNGLRRGHRAGREVLWALRDVSFQAEKGETLGIIGHNGSGKSTCLKLLTRILQPTQGTVCVQGRVSALLELGAGFHPELTGRENVYLYGAILGLRRREIVQRFDEIVSFAEVERFIDAPLKFYSSGMQVRLAFATAIHVHPDILLVDEVLAVGDQSFQEKCWGAIRSMAEEGVTIVFVSHNLDAVRRLCRRALWLDHGLLREDGEVEEVVQHYIESVHFQDARLPERPSAPSPGEFQGMGTLTGESGQHDGGLPVPEVIRRNQGRWGTREVEITCVRFLDAEGRVARWVPVGSALTIAIAYRAEKPISRPSFGISLYREDGLHVTGDVAKGEALGLARLEGVGEVRYHIPALPLVGATYFCSAAIFSSDQSVTYDYHNLLYPFEVRSDADLRPLLGVMTPPGRWEHRPLDASEGRA